MTTKQVVVKCMKSRGQTYHSLGDALGLHFTSVSDRLNKGNMRVDSLVEMLDTMGFDLLVKDRKNGSAPMKLNGISEEE